MGSLFGFISHPMELGLIWLAHAVGSAGIAIILFTIFVRLILSPFQITQLRNAKKMQRVQPLLAELKQKHGKDREAMSQATMALYKEHNVNPVMGCLPTILQFPILIGLFYGLIHLGMTPTFLHSGAFSTVANKCNGHVVHTMNAWLQQCYAVSGASASPHSTYSAFHARFLWLSNGLGRSDPLYILPLLAGVTQWVQSRMMMTTPSDPQQQTMNTMMNFMPLMIIFFALRYASGLPLYWVTSTLIGIAIQARITGFGTLPRPSFLGGTGGGGGLGIGNRPDRPRGPKQPRSTALNRTPKANADSGASDGQTGGSNGSTAKPQNSGARAVRKRTNRAKGGGRAGGRRG